MALQDLVHARWFGLEKAVSLPWTDLVHGRGLTDRRAASPSGEEASLRPAPPSRRLRSANMGRAAFLRLVAAWLTVLAALLVLVLVLRALA